MTFPHCEDAEKAIVCCFMLAADKVGPFLAERGVQSAWFHLPNTTLLFSTCMEMWSEGTAIDLITLTNEISKKGRLPEVGGAFGITEIFSYCSTLQGLREYVTAVEEDWKRRELIRMASECSKEAQERQEDPILVSSRLVEAASGLAVVSKEKPKTAKELAMGVVNRCQEAIDNKGKPKDVISTGFTEFDTLLNGGMRRGAFILVSAQTKGGKTIFSDNVVEQVSVHGRLKSLIFSLEMTADERADRIISSMGRIDATAMQMGWLTERDINSLQASAMKFANAPIVIRSDLHALGQIVGSIRQEKMKDPELAFVVVDYLQLIDEPIQKGETRENVVARISTQLRRLSIQLNLVIMFLAQENDDGRARESRRLEQDCTTWLQIESDKSDENVKIGKVRLNRNGPPGIFKMTHLRKCYRFENFTPERP